MEPRQLDPRLEQRATEHATDLGVMMPGMPWTPQAAQRAIVEANLVRELTNQPGWSIFTRRCEAMVESHHMQLLGCRPEQAMYHQECIKAFKEPLYLITRILARGRQAEQFLSERQSEETGHAR